MTCVIKQLAKAVKAKIDFNRVANMNVLMLLTESAKKPSFRNEVRTPKWPSLPNDSDRKDVTLPTELEWTRMGCYWSRSSIQYVIPHSRQFTWPRSISAKALCMWLHCLSCCWVIYFWTDHSICVCIVYLTRQEPFHNVLSPYSNQIWSPTVSGTGFLYLVLFSGPKWKQLTLPMWQT